MKTPLELSPIIESSSEATEIVRVWVTDGKPTFIISGNLFKDPAAWGLILSDLAKHISKACAGNGQDETQVLDRIKNMIQADLFNSEE